MTKKIWKPGTMLYPLPAIMVSCGDIKEKYNIITVAWTGTVCTDPAMTYISIRPERYSYDIIKDTGEFVINLTTEKLARVTDFCGVKSGRDIDKFAAANLTPEPASIVACPIIKECPVNIECSVKDIIKLGSHDMFLSTVLAINVDDKYLDEKGKLHLERADLMVYSHGEYYGLKKSLGSFGFSVRKKNK